MLSKIVGLKHVVEIVISLFLSLGLVGSLLPCLAGAAEETDLVEKARKEGKVVWYSGSNIGVINPVRKKFEEKYPFIKVEAVRASSGHSRPAPAMEAVLPDALRYRRRRSEPGDLSAWRRPTRGGVARWSFHCWRR